MIGSADHADQALRHGLGPGGILDAVEHCEFVAAQPGHHVAPAHMRPQPVGHRPQQRIAHRVAEAVVDRLEAVEIEAEHGEPRSVGRAQSLDQRGTGLPQEGAVGQVGEPVVAGHVDDLRLRAPTLGDVVEGRDPAAPLHGAVHHGHDAPVGQFAQHRLRSVPEERGAGALAHRVDRQAGRVAPECHQRGDYVPLAHADPEDRLRQVEDLPVAPVPDQQPLLRIEQAQPLAHVLQGRVEEPVLLAEPGVGLDQGQAGAVPLADVAADTAIAQEVALGREMGPAADLEPARRAVGMAVDVGQFPERTAGRQRLAITGERVRLLAGEGRPRDPDHALRRVAQTPLGAGGDVAEAILGVRGPEPVEGDACEFFEVVQRHVVTTGSPHHHFDL